MVTRRSIEAALLRRAAGLVAASALVMCAAAAPSSAQQVPPKPTKEDLAKDNQLFLTLARKALKWDTPTEPSKIVGPLYYVGTAGLSSFLFTTSEGHILFNTGMPESGPLDHGPASIQGRSRSA